MNELSPGSLHVRDDGTPILVIGHGPAHVGPEAGLYYVPLVRRVSRLERARVVVAPRIFDRFGWSLVSHALGWDGARNVRGRR